MDNDHRDILDQIVASILDTPDDEFLQELEEDGVDTEQLIADARDTLRRGVRDCFRKRRAELSQPASHIPTSGIPAMAAQQLRAIAARAIQGLSPKQRQLTLCYRELDELSENDLTSLITKMQSLGVLDSNLELCVEPDE